MSKRSGPQGHDKPAAKKTAKKTTARRSPAVSPRAARKSGRTDRPAPPPVVDADVRRAMVAQAAYFRAERRGFTPGRDLEDWVEAEREIERMLGH